MAEISLCMIVKDEEETLSRCLESAKDAVDEIIVVDTGSTDATKEIALRYTHFVYDFKWVDDFSAARNFSFSKATRDYLMWLDADDVLSAESRDKLKSLKKNLDKKIVYMPYHIAFDEAGKPTFSYYRERLVARSANPVWIEPIHEVISAQGTSIYTDIAVEHRKIKQNAVGRNLDIFRKHLAKGNVLSARLHFYFARELMYNNLTAEAVREFEDFLDSGEGWSENCLSACRDLSYCYESLHEIPKALDAALKGFRYARPRAELLCRIAELFLLQNRLNEAEYWYLRALECPKPVNTLGFVEDDFYGYIPSVQLCVIYDRLGQRQKAREYNEKAGAFKPFAQAYLYNKKYFECIIRSEKC
jgi:glycosyltransferase involved in cell wall biosynthesis